jgi:hypothetical protein
MSDLNGKGARELQDRFATRKLADRIEEQLVKDAIDDDARAFMNGNGMYLSNGAMMETGEVAMLFIDLDGQSRLRVSGRATIDPNDPLLPTFPEAELVVRVQVRKVFPNCPRYIHKRALVEASRFVPREGASTPVPSWKKSEWAADVVPASDAAHDPAREVLRR